MGNAPSRGEQFIHFTPNEPNTPAPEPTPASRARPRATARKGTTPTPPDETMFRLPAAALGRWAPGETGEEEGPEPGPLAVAAGVAGTAATNGKKTTPGAEATAGRRGARTTTPAAAQPGRNGAATARRREAPAGHLALEGPAASERRDMRSGYQDEWLNVVRRSGTPVELSMMSGSPIDGRLTNFDTYSLIVETDEGSVLVFKHAVAAVRPLSVPAREPE